VELECFNCFYEISFAILNTPEVLSTYRYILYKYKYLFTSHYVHMYVHIKLFATILFLACDFKSIVHNKG
jgi:hypothetical protein